MNKKLLALGLAFTVFTATACGGDSAKAQKPSKEIELYKDLYQEMYMGELDKKDDYEYYQDLNIIDDNYRNYYQVLVGTYKDSNGDGMGDFNGLTASLDYIEETGFNGIWLMPIFPSPTYHKYDATDYYDVDSDYGTLAEFENFTNECEKRGIKVIIDLAINHTSNNHPWFREGCRAFASGDTDNKYYDYYNFSKDYINGYHQGDNLWYEGSFYAGMPDLNLENPEVLDEVKNICEFWLDKGVGGFRFDAVMHVLGSDSENIALFEDINAHCKSIDKDYYAVAEVWSSSSRIASYYGSDMSVFNYTFGGGPSATYLATASTTKKANTYTKELVAWQDRIKAVDPYAIDATFLTNHDNTRVANTLYKSEEALKMACGLQMMSPGTTFTYYGEEIGMLSLTQGVDDSSRDPCRRMPMYWTDNSSDLTDPPMGAIDFKQYFPSLANQKKAVNSLYSYYERALRIRNENPEIARGDLIALDLGTDVSAYKSTYNGSSVIIIHNLSLSPKELDLKDLNYNEVRGYLSSTNEHFYIKGSKFTFPAYSTLILK